MEENKPEEVVETTLVEETPAEVTEKVEDKTDEVIDESKEVV